jgi:ABC-type sugar transport system, periplasmic component
MKIVNDVDSRTRSARSRRRVLALTAILVTATLGMAGCARASAGSSSSNEKIGFSAAVLNNPFTVHLVDGVETSGSSAGLNMVKPFNANGDTGQQLGDMNTLVSEGVKGIFLIPADSDAIVPGVKAANNAKIPVITVDTAANGGNVYMNIRADNVAMGKSACEQLGAAAGGKGTFLEIEGDLGTSSGHDRHEGFSQCMAQKYPGVKIISRPSQWVSATAASVAQTVLSTTPISGVFLSSDSVMLAGVAKVMQGLNKYIAAGQPGHVAMVSIDGSGPSLDAIRSGYLDAVISQPVNDYAKFGIQYMKDAIAGKKFKVGPSDHNSSIVLYHGSLADMLPSPVVTKKNVDDKNLWGNSK